MHFRKIRNIQMVILLQGKGLLSFLFISAGETLPSTFSSGSFLPPVLYLFICLKGEGNKEPFQFFSLLSHHLLKSCISLRKSENVSDFVADYDVVVFNASILCVCVIAVFMVKDIEKMMN